VIGKLGEYEKACLLLDRALKIEVTSHGYYHADVVHTMNNLGAILVEMGQAQRGKSVLQQALQIASSLYGAAHVELVGVLINLGIAFRAIDDIQSAKGCFDRARVIERRANSTFRRIGSQLKRQA
jgi:tetratricopeptide (TPR) repeat protein